MRKIQLTILYIFASFHFLSAQKDSLSLSKIFKENYFSVVQIDGFNFMKDNRYYTKVEHNKVGNKKYFEIVKMDVVSNQKVKTLFDASTINDSNFQALDYQEFSFSNDEKKMLLYFNGENIYRHSTKYFVYLFDTETKKLTKVHNEKILHAELTADGKNIVFVRDNNLYRYEIINGITTAITTDGKWNHIINGNADWVYEEEFSFTKAFQIAPDGNSLAFYRFDESAVPEYVMTKYNGLYPTPHSFKYPKAGERNSEIKIIHYDFATQQSTVAFDGTSKDLYFPRIKWANENNLCIFELNRHQNHLKYHIFNRNTSSGHVFLEDRNPYYIDISDQFHFIQDGNKFLYLSEQDGLNRVYLYDMIKKTNKSITASSQDVNELLGYNEVTGKIYYTSCGQNPYTQHLFETDIKSGLTKKLTKKDVWNTATASSAMQYFLINESSFTEVPVYTLINNKGNIMQTLEQNRSLKQKLHNFEWGKVQKIQLKSDDLKYDLNGYMITPPDFDSNKKYPLLMYQYSGPGSQEVKDRFANGNYFWHQYLAQHGYIVACFDGRGTGARGQEFKKSTYLQLGNLESNDQIALAKQLGGMPFVDKNRIGIWGWSYGGFMAATCILKGNDVFKTAVSVAPVTNWRYYDNIYTERYMRTPAENAKGYDDNAPEKMAEKLKGNLLIIHGTSDDNVHFQNAVMLTDALIKSNKQFESFYYPNKDHSIRGGQVRYQLFTKITQYLFDNL